MADVIGVGTDLVEIARFRLALERRGERLRQRLFSPEELAYADRHRDPAPRLAARFAVKEAVMKAMGVGLWKFKLRDIEVARAKSGAPSVVLYRRAAQMAAERGVGTWHLSISHSDTTAIAVAIAVT